MVLDPADALYTGMPTNAIEGDHPDYVMPLKEMAQKIQEVVAEPLRGRRAIRELSEEELVAQVNGIPVEAEPPGEPSGITCPDCSGALWGHGSGRQLHYQCRTGHAYSPQSLFAKQREAVEEALWGALAALEERASLADRIGERARESGRFLAANRYADEKKAALDHAAVIRELLHNGTGDANPAEISADEEINREALTKASV
jgi:two-component system chemotaxis response regulator CheB